MAKACGFYDEIQIKTFICMHAAQPHSRSSVVVVAYRTTVNILNSAVMPCFIRNTSPNTEQRARQTHSRRKKEKYTSETNLTGKVRGNVQSTIAMPFTEPRTPNKIYFNREFRKSSWDGGIRNGTSVSRLTTSANRNIYIPYAIVLYIAMLYQNSE